MSFLNGHSSDFFGLDIGSNGIHVVELVSTGNVMSLSKYAYTAIDPKLTASDAKGDQRKTAEIIKNLVSQARITTKNVAVGLPSQRVFTAVVDIERLSADDLKKTIKFQADALIPTPLAESKMDWALLGDSPVDKTKVEILLSSVSNDFTEGRLDMLEAIGLNVIAFEPENLALTRSMLPPDVTKPCTIVDIGAKTTNIVITLGGIPRLTRSIPMGFDTFIQAAMQNLNIDEAQAQQFVLKFGLSKQKLEGQIYQAISGTVDNLTTEIEKSLKFFNARYPNEKMDLLIVTGGASVIAEFPLYLANKFGLNVEIGNAWRNIAFPRERQNELMAISNQFGVAVGLAERRQ